MKSGRSPRRTAENVPFVPSASLQKALDAVAHMGTEMESGVNAVTVPCAPSQTMLMCAVAAAGISPAQARIAYEAMIRAA